MRLLNWLRRGRLESDLDRELAYHVDRRVRDLMLDGMIEREARRQARLEVGGVTQIQEEVRDVWLTRWARDFAYDLRFSARSIYRSPAFTATVILSLALGIGATTAIYSLVDQVLLHALPVRQPERLVLLDWKGEQAASAFGSYNLLSYPLCRDLQQQERFFDGVFCRATTPVNLAVNGDSRPAIAEVVSGNYFSILGVNAALGRLIETDDDRTPGASPVVVLSHDFWRTQMASTPDVVGRKIFINQHPMTVIGVASEIFRGIDVGEAPSLWMPASMSAAAITGFNALLDRRTNWMQILARLQPGISAAQAQSGLQPWFKAMLDDDMRRPGFPNVNDDKRKRFLASTLSVTPAPQGHTPLKRTLTTPLWVLLAATALLLGLACLNVAGLFLARGSARERELSTRLALGASRGRVARQFLADGILLALAAGALGIAIAPIVMQSLIAFLPGGVAPTALASTLDLRLLLFATLVSIAAGLLSSLAPAFQASKGALMSSLRERAGSGFAGVRIRKLIVTLQVAVTLILVVGAVLFARTLTSLIAKGPGFATSSLVSFNVNPIRNGYSREDAMRITRRIYDELRSSKHTENSALARVQLLTGGSWNNEMTIQSNRRILTDRLVNENAVTPGFFSALGVRLIAGRDFDLRDSRPAGETGRRSAIVNEAFAKRYLGGDALGARICEGTAPDAKPEIEIVGIVSNINYRGLREESEQAYFPIFEMDATGGTFYIRSSETAAATLPAIQSLVRAIDPALPVTGFRTLDEQVSRSLNTERLLATLSVSFGGLALLLAIVGLYGVTAFVVTQRTREIGIRMALGATGGSAIWMVLRDALWMIAAGAAIAIPVAAALGRFVESQLYGVKPTDPLAILLATSVLTLAAAAAAFIPAYRASTIDPVEALRFE